MTLSLYNAQMMLDVICVASLASMEHARFVWPATIFKAQLALHVLLTVMSARAALNALPAPTATTVTRTVAVQRVPLDAPFAPVQQSVLPVIRVIVSTLRLIFATHAVLPTALVAMSRIPARPARLETD